VKELCEKTEQTVNKNLQAADFGLVTRCRLPVFRALLVMSGVSGTLIPAIIRESRLVRESLQEGRYILSPLGVAATREKKYLSCSILDVVSLPAEPVENNN